MAYSQSAHPGGSSDAGAPRGEGSRGPSTGDFLVIRVRRSLVYAAVGVVAGFVIGFWVARLTVGLPEITIEGPVADGDASGTRAPSVQTPSSEPVGVSTEGRPARGPEDAPVTIVEFTDYQCPFCKRHFDEVTPTLFDTYGDDVRYVVRNFPLTSIHPQAQKAAEAAECAHAQGRFWEYHDTLFENPRALGVADLKGHARSVGLDEAEFDACLDGGETEDVVQADVEEGQNLGVSGTPTFFVNGLRYTGATPPDVFLDRIEQALEAGRG